MKGFLFFLLFSSFLISTKATNFFVSITGTPGQTINCSISDTIQFSCGGPYSFTLRIHHIGGIDSVLYGFGGAIWTIGGQETGFEMSCIAPNRLNIGYLNINTVSMNVSEIDNKILVYPNPTSDLLHVQLKQNAEDLSISNNLGKTIMTFPVSNLACTIDISDLSPGVYFIKTGSIYYRFMKVE